MLVARYWLAIPTLAIAGSLARRRSSRRARDAADAHAAVRRLLIGGRHHRRSRSRSFRRSRSARSSST
jgi:hypothetical protein